MTQVAPVAVTVTEGIATIVLAGDVDVVVADQVRSRVVEALAGAPEIVVFDFGQVTFVDSSGLGILGLALTGSADVVLRGASASVRRLVDAVGFTPLLRFEPA